MYFSVHNLIFMFVARPQCCVEPPDRHTLPTDGLRTVLPFKQSRWATEFDLSNSRKMTPQPSTASYYSTPTPLHLAHFPGGCHGDGKAAVSKGSVEDLPLLSGLIFSVSLSLYHSPSDAKSRLFISHFRSNSRQRLSVGGGENRPKGPSSLFTERSGPSLSSD